MSAYRTILMTLAIGAILLFSSFAGTASAEDPGSGTTTAGTTGAVGFNSAAGADHDGDGIPNCQDPDWTGPVGQGSGSAYQHRNTWKHRNVVENRYGEMGESAGSGQQRGFVDENGDGINDLARDHDGDGVPNGQDPDWVKNKRDGTGNQDGNLLSRGSRRCGGSQHRGNKRSQ